MQEQMNSMNDTGEFQDAESNFGGRLSHVSSQPAIIFKFSFHAEPRQTFASEYMAYIWITGKRFW